MHINKTIFKHALVIKCCLLPAIAAASEWTIYLTSSERFTPDRLDIRTGDTVTWVNNDWVRHEIRFEKHPNDPEKPILRHIIRKRRQASITFTNPGEHHYKCLWHGMHGTISVK